MAESNQMMSVEGQLVGLPLAGPESFSQQQLDYLKRALGVDETVLYEGIPGTAYGGSIVISEPITNFRSYKIYLRNTERQQQSVIERFVDTSNNGTGNNLVTLESFQAGINNDFFTVNSGCATWSSDWKTLSYSGGWAAWANNSAGWARISTDASNLPYIQKIIGIHRIAGGN